MSTQPITRKATSTRTRTRWWGFWVYAAVALLHNVLIITGPENLVYPTKLLLMPALVLAVIVALGRAAAASTPVLLIIAVLLSWLGDGADLFFGFADATLESMLLCFGLAHLVYMWLFARRIRPRRIPPWALVFIAWWIAMLVALWPHLGALQIPVAIYGLVLGGTAALSTRGGTLTAIGGIFFLASDTALAFRLFMPDVLPAEIGSPLVMTTYTIGQGLLAYGITRCLRSSR